MLVEMANYHALLIDIQAAQSDAQSQFNGFKYCSCLDMFLSLGTLFLLLFVAFVVIAFLVVLFDYAPPVYRPGSLPPDLEREPLLSSETSDRHHEQTAEREARCG